MEKVHSDVTGKDYYPSRSVRLINIRQICTFIRLGVLPVDIYPSVDFKSNNPVLVVIFDKEESKQAYERWKESEDLWKELEDGKNTRKNN